MKRSHMKSTVQNDPRYLYAYSPENKTADVRYVFNDPVRGTQTIRTLSAAFFWVTDNPPITEETDHG